MGTMATGRNDSFVTVVALKGVLMVVIAETTVEKSEVTKQCRTIILVVDRQRSHAALDLRICASV